MEHRIREAFGDVRADRALLDRTARYLETQRAKPRRATGRPLPFRRLVAAACAMVALVAGLFTYNAYAAPYAYVSVDINPSVELTLNRLDRVIATLAFNEDGERLLRDAGLRGLRYDDALAVIMQAAGGDGDGLVSVTVQTQDPQKQQELCETIERQAAGHMHADAALLEVVAVSEEEWANAHGNHMSPARYLAIRQLLEVDDEASLEAYSAASISQIRQRTQQCMEAHGANGGAGHGGGVDDGGDTGGGHHGQGGRGHMGGR